MRSRVFTTYSLRALPHIDGQALACIGVDHVSAQATKKSMLQSDSAAFGVATPAGRMYGPAHRERICGGSRIHGRPAQIFPTSKMEKRGSLGTSADRGLRKFA